MLLGSIILYLLITIGVGYWASLRVKTSGDFILAGRSLPFLLSSSALFATWFGSETVFGASSEFLKGGLYAVIEDPFGAALCLILFGLLFARKLYNMNLLTLGDFFEFRYGKRVGLVASVLMAPPYVGYIAAQLVAMSIVLNVVTGIDLWTGVVISSFVVTFYTFVGGMWAISITDFVQSIIIIAGLFVVAYIMSEKAGGVAVVFSEVPKENFQFLPRFESREIISYIAAWSVLGLGSLPSQDVFQRAMSSGSAQIAVRSCYFAALLYLTVAMLPLFISLCAKHIYGDQLNVSEQLTLPLMVMEHTNIIIQVLFFGSLLSAIMSTTSSAILAPASILAENIIKPLSGKEFSDKQLLRITRMGVLLFSAVATVMASFRTNIYHLVGESSILSLVTLFAPLTFGLYWKKTSRTGAILSMILGLGSWFLFNTLRITDIPSLIPATLISMSSLIIGSLLFRKSRLQYFY
ncbi:MAG: sodium:solute symporter [Flammeovirgaceae bacterium]|nr:sodium:solute symporter [Flammeovirgaceae bacterium]